MIPHVGNGAINEARSFCSVKSSTRPIFSLLFFLQGKKEGKTRLQDKGTLNRAIKLGLNEFF